MEQICQAIKTDGETCTKKAKQGETRCSLHIKTMFNAGGRQATELKELKYIYNKEITRFREMRVIMHDNANGDAEVMRNAHEIYVRQHGDAVERYEARKDAMLERHAREIRENGGIHPDREAIAAKQLKAINRGHIQRARREELNALARERAELRRRVDALEQRPVAAAAQGDAGVRRAAAALLARAADVRAQAAPQAAPVQPDNLGAFAADRQNVHTTQIVEMVKKTVARVLTIEVPEPYRWNMEVCSLTPGEIIVQCRLNPSAAWQMQAQYCQPNSIYEMEPGIYGKVLDCVWQFIQKSPDKNDLISILRTELMDNVGMCAQGNLSRLCNILAGYLDGIGSQESKSEILGRLLPPLAEIECLHDRLEAGIKILLQNGVEEDEWTTWLEPLFDGDKVGFVYDEGEITLLHYA